MKKHDFTKKIVEKGFTVVELLIVIVIIAILAAIVTIGYNTIIKQTVEASMKADLRDAVKELSLASQNSLSYPTTTSTLNNGNGLKLTNNNSISYEVRPYGYCMTITNSRTDAVYRVKSRERTDIEDGSCDVSINSKWVGSDNYGYADGTGSAVQFVTSGAYAIGPTAVDNQGNVYLSNSSGNRIRKIDNNNVVSTFIGNGVASNTDGTGTSAQIDTPRSIVKDKDGNFYVFAYGKIRKITPAGVTTTIINNGGAGVVGVDTPGNIWIVDDGCVKKHNPSGTVILTVGLCGTYGNTDGNASTARFSSTLSGTIDTNGTVYIADRNNNRIRKVTSDGVVSNYFGTGLSSGNNVPIDGAAGTATLNETRYIEFDSTGALWVTTKNNFMYLRKISSDGLTITTLGGKVDGVNATRFNLPEPGFISIDSANGYAYITGYSSYIWRVDF